MSSSHSFHLAPLRGITDHIFRNCFENRFGRFDSLLSPFIPTVRGESVCDSHVKDVLPVKNDIGRLVPQIIGNDPEQFIVLAAKMKELGYSKVNWNLGCPFPQVAKKKRGAGLLPFADMIDAFLEKVFLSITCALSVKVRLGYQTSSDLAALIPVFNSYPISEIIIHARTGAQMYEGSVDLDTFEIYAAKSIHPVVYNGDIFTYTDFENLSKRFPFINGWMIGRGVLYNPFLLQSVRTGGDVVIKTELIKKLHDDIFTQSSEILCGPSHLLGRMKELWSYLIACFPAKTEYLKKIRKVTTVEGYLRIVNELF